MGLFSKDAPTPPNPIATAGAQTSTNIGTAVANAFLNNTNQVTPQGSLQYDQTSTYTYNDPVTGQSYSVPRFTATQNLSPDQQEISNLNVKADKNLAGLAANQSGMLQGLLGTPMNIGGAPGVSPATDWLDVQSPQGSFADVGGQQRSLGDYGQQQYTFNDAGPVVRDYGTPDNFNDARKKVEESLYQRMDPQLQRDRASMEARLSDQGLRQGDPAYAAAMDQFNRQLTDTRLAITAQGGQEQKLQADMAAQRAGFQNAAEQQVFNQWQARGQFANQAQMEQFQKQLQGGTFANQAQQQDFQQQALRGQFYNSAAAQQQQRNQTIMNAQIADRSRFLQEQYAQRNQPINEITALLSGSQVQNPSFVNTPNNQIPTTDVAGLINNRFSQDMDSYKQQSANFNSLMGGIFGAMGGMIKSDREEKKNIDRVGTVFAAGPDGEKPLPIYEYAYKDDPASTRHTGPMAQDVEKIDRRAVKTIRGVKHIDMTRMGSILKAA